MFQFPGLASSWMYRLQRYGFPHSEIFGSRSFAPPRSFSQLTTSFARLQEPRHSSMCPFLLFCQCNNFNLTRCVFFQYVKERCSCGSRNLRQNTGIEPATFPIDFSIELIHLISISLPPLRQCIRIGIKLLPPLSGTGGEYRSRTDDPSGFNLFYPAFSLIQYKLNRCSTLVENIGVEPMTSPVSTGMLYPAFSLFANIS